MDREKLAARITEIQNTPHWTIARADLINLISNDCRTQEDFELVMEEIQNRDWIW